MARTPISEAQIDRRISFLISEARLPDAFRDQTVTYAFRVITNLLAVGDDVSSQDLARRCRYRSRGALELSVVRPGDWYKEKRVRNEHQYPIKRAWAWMLRERESLSIELVKAHLRQWPVVVVTAEEDRRLKDDPSESPAVRYANAGIEVLQRDGEGRWVPVHLPDG